MLVACDVFTKTPHFTTKSGHGLITVRGSQTHEKTRILHDILFSMRRSNGPVFDDNGLIEADVSAI
jgi:hypothetical protein